MYPDTHHLIGGVTIRAVHLALGALESEGLEAQIGWGLCLAN